MYTYVYVCIQKRRLRGLRFCHPSFSAAVVLYVSSDCVWVSLSVGRSLTLSCYKPRGLFINTGLIYEHCISVYHASSVFSMLDNSDLPLFLICRCLTLVSYVLVVCLFVRFHHIMLGGRRGMGGNGGRSVGLMFQDPPPHPHHHQHCATDSNQLTSSRTSPYCTSCTLTH